ncbi:Uncharacterised protein [Brucella anthropi]|nr:hypothetical protein DR92_4378 [Brucella anthropi]SUB43518.1 Uncharacterised protein [Brucella anthropi]
MLRKMKGSRLLPKNLLPNASPPAIGGAMLTSMALAEPEFSVSDLTFECSI